jgi:hypothetical protein
MPTLLGPLQRTNLNHWTTHDQVSVEVTLRLTVSLSLGVEPTVGFAIRY